MNRAQAWGERFHALRAAVAHRQRDQADAQAALSEHVDNRPRFVGPDDFVAQVENTGKIHFRGWSEEQIAEFLLWLDTQRAVIQVEQAVQEAKVEGRTTRRVVIEGLEPDDPPR